MNLVHHSCCPARMQNRTGFKPHDHMHETISLELNDGILEKMRSFRKLDTAQIFMISLSCELIHNHYFAKHNRSHHD